MVELSTSENTHQSNIKDNHTAIRVLVLDDEATLRDLVKQSLEQQGCEVDTASDGEEGLQILLSKQFDVVVSDLMMEPMDGITFLTEALRIWPWIGTVVFSGYVTDETRAKAAEIGVTTILEKPVSFQDMVSNVMEEAERKRQRLTGRNEVTLEQTQYQLNILRNTTTSAIEANKLTEALHDLSHSLGEILPSIAAGILTIEDGNKNAILVLSVREQVTESFIEKTMNYIRDRYRLLSGNPVPEDINLKIHGEGAIGAGHDEPLSIFSVPIMSGGSISGMLALIPPPDYTYSQSDMSFLYHAANHLTTVLIAFQRIRNLAVRDELTGLYNRRHLRDSIKSTWQMAHRYGFCAGVLLVDIDHFKLINDTYGHLAGDQVLRELAEVTSTICRNSDMIARYGGDEIIIVLPDAVPADLSALGERLLKAIRDYSFCADKHDLHCTVSIGATSSRTENGDMYPPEEVLARADGALYTAKRNGRDRCAVWSQDSGHKEADNDIDVADEENKQENKATTIAVIDDDKAVLDIMKLILEIEGHNCEVFSTASDVRDYVTTRPGYIDIAFVDLNLNDANGLDLIQELHGTDSSLVAIVITGDATLDNAVNSLRYGAYDFIQKPIQREQLKVTLARAIEYRQLRVENKEYQGHLEDMVKRKSRELTTALQRTRDSYDFTLRAMANLLDVREHATGKHSQRVQEITRHLAQEIGLDKRELDDVCQGALLHDIGKIGIPDAILLKAGPLTEDEWEVMRTHAQIGYDIIKTSPYLEGAAMVIGSHHEKWDGTGYPKGLAGEEIPIGARVFTLADSYDAMRSDRPYRKGLSKAEAMAEIINNRGKQYDPELVDLFVASIDKIERIGNWEEN